MSIRKIDENHVFFDVTPGSHRGYDWELCEAHKNEDGLWEGIRRLGRKADDETFCEAARRMGVEPTHREAKLAGDAAAQEISVETMRAQVRYVTQAEIDFLGGIEAYRRDIEPYRQIVIVASRHETGVDYQGNGCRVR